MVRTGYHLIYISFAVVFLAWYGESFAQAPHLYGGGVNTVVTASDVLTGAPSSPPPPTASLPVYMVKNRVTAANKVVIVACDQRFAPSVENMDIKYTILPAGSIASYAKLEVFAADDLTNPIFTKPVGNVAPSTGATGANIPETWAGTTTSGAYVIPKNKPYIVKISITGKTTSPGTPDWTKGSTAVAQTSVEVESIQLFDGGDLKFIKPNRTATEIEHEFSAMVKVKDKSGAGVITEIPIPLYWSYIDPDDDASAPGIDMNGAAGDDNVEKARNGKRNTGTSGAADPMWKASAGFTFVTVDNDRCISQTSTTGAYKGKTKVTFLASVVGGDNYNLKPEAYAFGSGVVDPTAWSTWTVWKKLEFAAVYQMNEQDFFGQTFRTAQISGVLSPLSSVPEVFNGSGCYDIIIPSPSTSLNLIKKPFIVEFDAPLLPEQVTPEDLAAFNLPALNAAHDAGHNAILAKAQAWFDRNMHKAGTFAANNNLTTPCIIGACRLSPFHDNDGTTAGAFPDMYKPVHPTDPTEYIRINDGSMWSTSAKQHQEVLGLCTANNTVFIFNNGNELDTDATWRDEMTKIARHEVGHATDHVQFGLPAIKDHASSGLMTEFLSSDTFSDDSIQKLRGRKP